MAEACSLRVGAATHEMQQPARTMTGAMARSGSDLSTRSSYVILLARVRAALPTAIWVSVKASTWTMSGSISQRQ